MRAPFRRCLVPVGIAMALAVGAAVPVSADHGAPHVELQAGTNGCTGVLPSNDGNTDMRVIGGTMYPGGTAIFEISYPLNAASVGKEFTILDCAFINDVAELKYIVSFVPSNQAYVLRIALAIPDDAPVGGRYCNYVKTTGSPTSAQASQRNAGPACFIIRPRPTPASTSTGSTPPPSNPPASNPPASDPPGSSGTSTTGAPILLPDTAMQAPHPRASAHLGVAHRPF